jgi:DNA polymerase-3 subunit chi
MTETSCEVWFYRLESTRLERALPELLERTLQRGWRAVVRAKDAARVAALDEHLWTWREDSFLAHGRAQDPDPERQPILLTSTAENPNGAQALFCLDGTEPGDLTGFARCMVMFDGADEAAVETARAQWREVTARNLPRAFWRQTVTGWEKQS